MNIFNVQNSICVAVATEKIQYVSKSSKAFEKKDVVHLKSSNWIVTDSKTLWYAKVGRHLL